MNDRVVVDASLAIKWVIDEPYSAEARSLLIDWEQRAVDRIVPVLFLSEIHTPLLRRRRDESLSFTDVVLAREDLLAAVIVLAEDADLAARALMIADSLALRNGYDSLYAALAEREGCEYWTGDELLDREPGGADETAQDEGWDNRMVGNHKCPASLLREHHVVTARSSVDPSGSLECTAGIMSGNARNPWHQAGTAGWISTVVTSSS